MSTSSRNSQTFQLLPDLWISVHFSQQILIVKVLWKIIYNRKVQLNHLKVQHLMYEQPFIYMYHSPSTLTQWAYQLTIPSICDSPIKTLYLSRVSISVDYYTNLWNLTQRIVWVDAHRHISWQWYPGMSETTNVYNCTRYWAYDLTVHGICEWVCWHFTTVQYGAYYLYIHLYCERLRLYTVLYPMHTFVILSIPNRVLPMFTTSK